MYPLDYDPLRDIGKHNCDAKGFAALEEYNVSDIAILREHRTQLAVLLSQLDYNRSLHMDSRYFGHEWCYGVYGSYVEAKTLGEELAIRCYNAIPRQVTHNEDGRRHYIYETPESEQLRKDLTEMERKCADALRKYQLEKIDQITTEIKDLIGIVIYKYNPD